MDAITQANRDGHFKGILTVTQAYHLECLNMVSFYNGWPQWSLKGTPLQSLCLLYSPVRFLSIPCPFMTTYIWTRRGNIALTQNKCMLFSVHTRAPVLSLKYSTCLGFLNLEILTNHLPKSIFWKMSCVLFFLLCRPAIRQHD